MRTEIPAGDPARRGHATRLVGARRGRARRRPCWVHGVEQPYAYLWRCPVAHHNIDRLALGIPNDALNHPGVLQRVDEHDAESAQAVSFRAELLAGLQGERPAHESTEHGTDARAR